MALLVKAFALDITPNFKVQIGGHGRRLKHVTKVLDPLEVNCVIIRENNTDFVLISFDLLYVGLLLRNKIEEELVNIGIPSENIFIGASHTHHAPMVDPTKPLLGAFDSIYFDWLLDAFMEKFRQEINSRFSIVDIEFGIGKSRQGVSRRAKRFKFAIDGRGFLGQYVMKPNFNSPIDDSIRRMLIRNRVTGEVISEIWSASIHPTARKPGPYLSADYPGFVRSKLRKFHNRNIPILFFQGFSGDVRPYDGNRSRNLIRLIFNGGGFASFSQYKYENWSDRLSRELLSIKTNIITDTHEPSIQIKRVPVDSSFFTIEKNIITSGFIHILYILNMAFVGIPAEVVSAYGLKMAESTFEVWPIGCIDHVFSYIPTSQMLRQGGYEANGFCKYFGCGPVNGDIENALVEILREI